jgi:predicted SAM-dependent methyltransferase
MGIKLDLGSGPTPFRVREGYPFWKDSVTMDIIPQKHPNIDIIADASKHIPLENGSVSNIICVEVIEHIGRYATDNFIKEIYRVLEPGGTVLLQCPDFEKAALLYLDKNAPEEMRADAKHCIIGGQRQEFDLHRNIFIESELIDLFKKAGFSQVVPRERVDIDFPKVGWNWKNHIVLDIIK